MALLEIARFNAESALIANKAGADRIEFCESLELGGTTPDLTILRNIKDQIAIPVFVMIRPRGGDFVYTQGDFQQMRASIEIFKEMADRFVFGVLDADRKVDIQRTKELVSLARPLPCTFHRAFDQTVDLYDALDDVVRCGMSTILTSRGASSALEGRDTLAKLVQTARARITIMPGGGIRSTNIEVLRRSTQAGFYHSSALVESGQVASLTEICRLRTSCSQSLNHDEAL